MPDQSKIDIRLEAACNMADQVRTLTQPAFVSGLRADNKNAENNKAGVFDPVTKADKDAELLLRSLIEKAFPGDSIVGEEYPNKTGDNDWSWCLDPIDGTRAFVAGVPVWSTLIAVSFRGEPIIGIIDHPALNERYIGAPDRAWREDVSGTTALKTQICPDLNDAVLSCTEPMAMFSSGQLAAYEMIRRNTRFTRLGLDAYGFALTAAGRIDLVIEAGLAPYDIQSHIPIIKGAGGVVTTWHGGNAKDGGAIVCAGDPRLLDQVSPYLQKALDN